MTNQVTSITRNRLEDYLGEIKDIDMVKLDIQLISTLSLTGTVQSIIQEAVTAKLEEFGYYQEDEEA